MATLAGSVTVNPTTGVVTGSGMALVLYNALIASPTYAGIVENDPAGVTLQVLINVRKAVAELANTFAVIADGARWIPVAKSSAYSAAPWELVLCDPTSAGFTVTLPAPSAALTGVSIRVKNDTASTHTLTIVAADSSQIEGAASFAFGAIRASYEFTCTGSKWAIAAAWA